MRAPVPILCLVVIACSPRPASPPDAGDVVDAGNVVDAGHVVDAGNDAGSDGGTDAGPVLVTLRPGFIDGVAVGDFDHDGVNEIAASAPASVLILRADGGLAIELPALIPGALLAADLDRDGTVDLVSLHGAQATVWLGLAPSHDFPTGTSAVSVAAADFDLDGPVDLAVLDESGSQVVFLHGQGDGGFGDIRVFATGLSPAWITTSDFDHDGRPDLATADFDSFGVGVLLGIDGGFSARVGYPGGAFPLGIVTIDFDRDGFDDLATACSGAHEISLHHNERDGGFTRHSLTPSFAVRAIVAADFDHDGRADLAASSYALPGALTLYFGAPDGGFSSEQVITVGPVISVLAAGDLDGDGDDDLVIGGIDAGVSYLPGRSLHR